MKKLKIAVWHNLPSGGGKRQLYYHVKGLIERGHYVESWCPDTADQTFLPLGSLIKENILPLEAKSADYGIIRNFPVARDLINAMEQHCNLCAEQINSGGFDVLFANACMYLRTTPIAKYVDIPSAIYLGEPYRWFYEALPELPWIAPAGVSTIRHSLDSIRQYMLEMNGTRFQARRELEYARDFDMILVNSIFSRETVLRTYNLESTVCYLGIDTDFYRPTGEAKENFVVGIGTIYHAKGIDRAIRAVATITKEKRPVLIWIGNGASDNDLKRYIVLANKLDVVFVPKVNIPDSEVISLLSRASVMVYTPRLEPFGLAPLEANACGTAVIGIAEGGLRETIKDDVNGYLVREDDPQALGELIYKFVTNSAFAAELGLRAQDYVKRHWNLTMCTDNIESRLSDLSARHRAPLRELLSNPEIIDKASANDITTNIEQYEIEKGRLRIRAWAIINDGTGMENSEIYVVAKNETYSRAFKARREKRPDVTDYFGNAVNYDDSGFYVDELLGNCNACDIAIAVIKNDKAFYRKLEKQEMTNPHVENPENCLYVQGIVNLSDEIEAISYCPAAEREMKLNQELERANQELERANQRNEELLASLSWKITAPLRRLYEMIRPK